MRFILLTTFAIFLAINTVKADYKPDCNSGWGRTTDALSAANKDLSTCQNQKLGFDKLNDNLIGGKGDADIVGIPAGSDSGGCSSDNACMQMCQAMCCLQDGCLNAEVYQSKKTTDYVVYKETEYKYYCRMKTSGSKSGSSRTTYCTRPNPISGSNCPALVASSIFNWDSATYDSLLSIQNNNTCASSGRKLLKEDNKIAQSAKDIEKKIKKAFKPFRALKKSLRRFTSGKKCSALKKLNGVTTSIIEKSCPSS